MCSSADLPGFPAVPALLSRSHHLQVPRVQFHRKPGSAAFCRSEFLSSFTSHHRILVDRSDRAGRAMSFPAFVRTDEGRLTWDRFRLAFPVMAGSFVIATTAFARTLGT